MARVIDVIRSALTGEGVGSILARGASGAMVVKIAAAGAGFLSHLVLANLLELRSFGDYVYVLGWVNVISQFTTLGMASSALRYIPTYRAESDWSTLRGFLRRSTEVTLVTSVAAGLALAAVAWLGAEAMRRDLVLTFAIGALVLVLLSLLKLLSAQVQAARWIVRALAPVLVARPLATAAAVALFYVAIGPKLSGAWALTGNLGATALVLLVVFVFRQRSTPPQARAATPRFETRLWLRVAFSFVLLSGFVYLLSRIDILMLGALVSTEEAGTYSVAVELSTLVLFGLHAVNAIVSPMIAELYAAGRQRQLERVVGLGALASASVGLTALVVLVFAGPWLLGLFGPEFVAAYTATILLATGKVVLSVIGLGGPVMTMTGHHRRAAQFAAVALVVNIALNVLLIPRYASIGAAIATATALLVWNLLPLFYVVRKLRIDPTPVALLARRRSGF